MDIHLWDNYWLQTNPRWGEMDPGGQGALIVLIIGLPIALILWLYTYEMRLVKRSTAAALLLLRLVVILVIVTLVCFQPAVIEKFEAEKKKEPPPGRVIVAVDVSRSMDVPDPQLEPLEKLRIARALRLAERVAATELLDDWIEQYQKQKADLVWVKPNEFKDDDKSRQRAENERRQAYAEVIRRVDELTRTKAVHLFLSEKGVDFLGRVSAKNKIDILGFGKDLQELTQTELDTFLATKAELISRADRADRAAEDNANPDKAPKKPAAEPTAKELEELAEGRRLKALASTTDMVLPLTRAQELLASHKGRVPGIILLTDGRHNAGSLSEEKARNQLQDKAKELRDLGIPLYLIALGGAKPPPDIVVQSLEMPPSVFKEVEAPITVRFRATGIKKGKLVLKIFRAGEEDQPLQRKEIDHDGKDQEYIEHVQVLLDKEGRQTLIATVEPADADVKETDKTNNKQSVVVNVADDHSKVLLVDGEARWEFHYLWNALLRDRSMKVQSVVFVQPRLGKVPEAELKKVNHPALLLPPAKSPTEDPLFDYDCIILGDVAPEQLSMPDRQRLEKYVADRGGTLVVLAGKRGMPRSYMTPPKPGETPPSAPEKEKNEDPILRLLPIEQPREVAPVDGFPITLTEDGKQADFLRMEAEGEIQRSLERWASLPRHYWGVVGKAKPGAVVLAHIKGDEAEDAKPEDPKPEDPKLESARREKERERAIFVRHNYGFGRVFFVGLDSTWRWRYRQGDLYHHRFWSQTIRWAASDKPLMAGNPYVRFGTPQAIFRNNEPVSIVLRLTEEASPIKPEQQVQARILRKDAKGKDETVALVPMKAREFQPRVFEGKAPSLPPGSFEIQPVITDFDEKLQGPPGADGKPGELRAAFSVAEGDSAEMRYLAADLDLLSAVARANGAERVYTIADAPSIVDKLTAQVVKEETPPPEKPFSPVQKLWQWWPLLLLVLLLLTIEWVARKWVGLP